MLLGEVIRVAFGSLRVNVLRSLLTMLGIVIGVGSVIAMIALGTGAGNAVRDKISKLGTTVLQINASRINLGGVNTNALVRLTMRDVDGLNDRLIHAVGVNQQQDGQMQVVWRNRNAQVQVTGTTTNFLDIRGFRIEAGRMFTDREDRGRMRVAVLGALVLPLLGIDNPEQIIGEPIRIAGHRFIVIGVLAERGVSVSDGDQQVLIPFSSGRYAIFGTDRVGDIWVKAESESLLVDVMGEIESAIRRTHKLRPGQPDDFIIRNQSDFLTALNETTATFTALLAGIAAVSLLVGGIGVMNIMLVSVTERTREVGIRRALGATKRNILMQFLVEAVVLCIAGGALGIAAGAGAAVVMSRQFGWETAITPSAVLVSFAFASAVGLIFGVWPARRAAGLDPITALRHE